MCGVERAHASGARAHDDQESQDSGCLMAEGARADGWRIIDAVRATGQEGGRRARVGLGCVVDESTWDHSHSAQKPTARYRWAGSSGFAASSFSIRTRAGGAGASSDIPTHAEVCMEWIREENEASWA
jgi:hypothetical protein